MSNLNREQLEEIAENQDQSHGFTPHLIRCRASVVCQYIEPGRVLDLGCSDGLLTKELANHHTEVVAVDGSAARIARARENCRGLPVRFIESMFDDYVCDAPFDAINLSCVVEAVADPIALLSRCRSMLRPGGKIACIAPHGGSLHRLAGVHMGLLPNIEAPGHDGGASYRNRVYTLDALRSELIEAGFEIVESGGILLKPVPNAAMQALDVRLLDAYEALGRQLPELAAEVFTIGLRRA